MFFDFEQVFYDFFFFFNFVSVFCSSGLLYFFIRITSCHSNEAAQKLCGTVVVLEVHRKLTCSISFSNVGGCKTQILMELGYIRELYLKSLRRTILEKSAF